jgi:uncharacterized protein YjiS (DUF1127 family)
MFSLSSLVAPFRRGDRRRSAVRTLGKLTPAQLRDLGIPEGGIDFFVESMLNQNEHRAAPRRPAAVPARIGPFAVGRHA